MALTAVGRSYLVATLILFVLGILAVWGPFEIRVTALFVFTWSFVALLGLMPIVVAMGGRLLERRPPLPVAEPVAPGPRAAPVTPEAPELAGGDSLGLGPRPLPPPLPDGRKPPPPHRGPRQS